MNLIYSKHWIQKSKYRIDIKEFMIEYVIQNSPVIRDKHWPDAYNAVCKIEYTGKRLKVVYKRIKYNKIKVITAFWID